MKHKARVGDVFLLPIEGSRMGIGQVAGDRQGELYFVIYDVVHETAEVEPASVLRETPLFAALSMDAKIYHGDWPIIGNVPENLARIPQPVFKVDQGGQTFLESRDRSVYRPASSAEAETLRLRTVVAPIRLEKALKAYNGVGEWTEIYDDLRAGYALQSSRLIPG